MQRVKRIPVIIEPPSCLPSNRENRKIRPPRALGDDAAVFAGSQNDWQFDHRQKIPSAVRSGQGLDRLRGSWVLRGWSWLARGGARVAPRRLPASSWVLERAEWKFRGGGGGRARERRGRKPAPLPRPGDAARSGWRIPKVGGAHAVQFAGNARRCRKAPPSIPGKGQTAGGGQLCGPPPAVCPRTQRLGAWPKGRALRRCGKTE